MNSKTLSSAALIALIGLSGCGRDAIPQVPAHPLGDRYGEHYDLKKFEECHSKDPRDTRCEIYRLTRIENPEVWPYPNVPPVKWPDPPKESVYKPGMTGVDYWRALCKAEAGEFIYKRVENVEGIYQIRPRKQESEYAMTDRYVMEDPYGYVDAEAGGEFAFMFVGPSHNSPYDTALYNFIETPLIEIGISPVFKETYDPSLFKPAPIGAKYQRFFGYDKRKMKTLQVEYVHSIKAKYGFTWRGIRRTNDRALGVAGGEVAVVDLKTGEVLGLRRGFILGGMRPDGGVFWLTGNACPEYSKMGGVGKARGRNKDINFTMWFLTKVLRPRNSAPGER